VSRIHYYSAKFEAFMSVKIQVEVFWVVTPCSVVVGYQCIKIHAAYPTQRHNPKDLDLNHYYGISLSELLATVLSYSLLHFPLFYDF